MKKMWYGFLPRRRRAPFPGQPSTAPVALHVGVGCPASGRGLDPQMVDGSSSASGTERNIGSGGHNHQTATIGITKEQVCQYLRTYPNVLEEYIYESVCSDQLAEWLRNKVTAELAEEATGAAAEAAAADASKPTVMQAGASGPETQTTLAKGSFVNFPRPQPRYMCQDTWEETQKQLMEETTAQHQDVARLLYELAHVLALSVRADTVTLYVGGTGLAGFPQLYRVSVDQDGVVKPSVSGQPVQEGTTIAAYVAHTRAALLINDPLGDSRFPKGVGLDDALLKRSVLCVPVTNPAGDLLGILEMVRDWKPFFPSDLHMVCACSLWASLCLYQAQVNNRLKKQARFNEFLLEVSKTIFDDIIVMDKLVEHIMLFTKELMGADRCSMFMVDEENQELYSNFFDDGEFDEEGKPKFSKREEVRFPITNGIAGAVATSGQVINIHDAYADSRFNKSVDKLTGYTTRAMLCMPIISHNKVIGVVQMINKKDDSYFSEADSTSFCMFAVYCALALHYSRMYSNVIKQTNMYQVALEMLQYHSAAPEIEISQVMRKPIVEDKQLPEDFFSLFFYIAPAYNAYLPQMFIKMYAILFGENSFDMEKMVRFTLTIRKNYRPLSYHNWRHGFSVAHAMFMLLLTIQPRQLIDKDRQKALLVASLCHDVDHRGFNNTFLQQREDSLAVLYETSTMEMHHFFTTLNILQVDAHNIFSDYTPQDYKKMINYMKSAIKATDLALYINRKDEISKLTSSGNFSFEDGEHYKILLDLMMGASDLMVICKSWAEQKEHTTALYEELYAQGDEERARGGKPAPMMDRYDRENIPNHQVGFLKFVCLPMYKSLAEILPELEELPKAVLTNMEQWERAAWGEGVALWEPAKSRPSSVLD